MKKALAQAAKGSIKWVAAVVLSIVGYLGTGLIPIIVLIKALKIGSVPLFLLTVFAGVVAGGCFFLLIKATINKITVGVFSPMNVIVADKD
jgi:hypothetical protein